MSTTNSEPDRPQLEASKLELEIAQMEMPWWKKPSYLGVVLPVGLAIITLLGGIGTGYFDAERARLKADTQTLVQEKRELLQSIAELQATARQAIEHLQTNVDSLDSITRAKLFSAQQLRSALEAQGISDENLNNEIIALEESIDDIKQLNTTTKELLSTLPSFEKNDTDTKN